jgi:AbrB family looped-hinge helix DNA binding protein
MRLRSRVGPKGQAVIPKEVREILGISPGDEVVFEVGKNEARIRPAEKSIGVSELTRLIPVKDKLSKDVDFKKLILSEAL